MAAALKAGAAAWRDAGDTPRYHLYRVIHKGLRGFMTDTLLKVGRMDVGDDCEVAQAIEQLRGLLAMCSLHLKHENDHVHSIIEAASPGASQRTAHEHVGHVVAIKALEQQVAQFEAASPVRRIVLAHELYLDLSTFVAENLEHMVIEETENHAALVAAYSDDELLGVEHRIVESMQPEQSMVGLRWMLPHMNAAERALMLGGMKRNAPPEAFSAVMTLAGELLSQRDFYKLQTALG